MQSDAVFRVIGLIDMDCFECQIYQNDKPNLNGKPCIVSNSKGRIVSVNYEARRFGISRSDRVPAARKKCNSLTNLPIPDKLGKPDNSKLRHASHQVLDIIKDHIHPNNHRIVLEFSPNDEFYLDLTRQVDHDFDTRKFLKFYHWIKARLNSILVCLIVHCFMIYCLYTVTPILSKQVLLVVLWIAYLLEFVRQGKMTKSKMQLSRGASLVRNVCNEIKHRSGMTASGGISTNKFRAKLASSENKPNGISILPQDQFYSVIDSKQIRHVPGLKGKLGEKLVTAFSIEMISQLRKLSRDKLRRYLDEAEVDKIINILQGIDPSLVIAKEFSAAIHCAKTVFTVNKGPQWKWGDLLRVKGVVRVAVLAVKTFFGFLASKILPARVIKSKTNLDNLLKDRCTEMFERLEEEEKRNARTAINLRVDIEFLTIPGNEATLKNNVRTFMPNWSEGPVGIAKQAASLIRTTTTFNDKTMQLAVIGMTAKNWRHSA